MADDNINRGEVNLAYRNGLHLTPIQLLVKQSNQFDSEIQVLFDGKTANAKSAMDLLLLGATHGALLTIEAKGVDAQQAVEAAIHVLANEHEVDGPA